MAADIKVVVESHVPYVAAALAGHARVTSLAPEDITPAAVRDADALVVRTRTRCDARLLDGSRVTLVGTATIGTDHIDMDYCASRGITVASAPGCNAPAVAQWVTGTLRALGATVRPAASRPLTLGVVGVGHVGSIVARWAARLGYDVLLCDPPRAAREGGAFVALDEVLESADIITLHVPLSRDGRDATYHMIDGAALSRARRCRLLLNAARGPVCDTQALLDTRGDMALAIDCWEHEPLLSLPLLRRAAVATPHIAGYSIEGKQRGAAMVLEALARHFDIHPDIVWPAAPATGIDGITWQNIHYDPLADTAALRACPSRFEQLRNHYALRHEPFE